MNPMPPWVTVFSAFLTPTIAILGAYIAWQQWRTARHKLVLDLFDRRLKVIADLNGVISEILGAPQPDIQLVTRFIKARDSAVYLFGKEVIDYLDATNKRIGKLRYNKAALNRQVGNELNQAFEYENVLIGQLSTFSKELEELARPYTHLHFAIHKRSLWSRFATAVKNRFKRLKRAKSFIQ